MVDPGRLGDGLVLPVIPGDLLHGLYIYSGRLVLGVLPAQVSDGRGSFDFCPGRLILELA